MATIAIRKGMDEYQAVMESRCNFIRLIGSILDPVTTIIEKLPEIVWNAIGIHPDIPSRTAEFTRPSPDPAKHPLVQIGEEALIQHITFARKRPFLSFQNIRLLCFI